MSAKDSLIACNVQRETGHFIESLKSSDQALVEFSEEQNPAGFIETLSARSLTLRHLFQKTNDNNYIKLAKDEMILAYEYARSLDDNTLLALPSFNLAKIFEELNNYPAAIALYQVATKSMKENPPESHNRPAVLADFKIHLATAN